MTDEDFVEKVVDIVMNNLSFGYVRPLSSSYKDTIKLVTDLLNERDKPIVLGPEDPTHTEEDIDDEISEEQGP